MNHSTDPNLLKFEVLVAIAKQSDGTLNNDKLRRIIRILRPDRDGKYLLVVQNLFFFTHSNVYSGYLSLLEFVKSVDVVSDVTISK